MFRFLVRTIFFSLLFLGPAAVASNAQLHSDVIESVSIDEGRIELRVSGVMPLSDRLSVTADKESGIDRGWLAAKMEIQYEVKNDKIVFIKIISKLPDYVLEH